ncbi:MAG: hypothetical protein HYY04_11605 [Chloroflexi bacterium]|nr:hypothetical protein [Chloroflexota bacterium]
MTKAEAEAFKARWKAVNAAEIEELRATPPERKLRQLASLMATARALGWDEALAAEEAEVRERWIKLKRVLGG